MSEKGVVVEEIITKEERRETKKQSSIDTEGDFSSLEADFSAKSQTEQERMNGLLSRAQKPTSKNVLDENQKQFLSKNSLSDSTFGF